MREDGQLNGKSEGHQEAMQKASGGFMAQEGLWNIVQKRMFEDRGALPREDGDLLWECQATHEENFLSSWLREGVEGKEMERGEVEQGSQRRGKKKWKRERWRKKGKG